MRDSVIQKDILGPRRAMRSEQESREEANYSPGIQYRVPSHINLSHMAAIVEKAY